MYICKKTHNRKELNDTFVMLSIIIKHAYLFNKNTTNICQMI